MTLTVALLAVQLALVVAAICVMLYMAAVLCSFRKAIPFVPTGRRVARRMAREARIAPGDRVVDLGSGTGALLVAAALEQPQALVTGYEETRLTRTIARLRIRCHPGMRRRVTVIGSDFFSAPMETCDVALLFLTPDALRSLEPLFARMPAGARVVTYLFPRPEYTGFSERAIALPGDEYLYLYEKI